MVTKAQAEQMDKLAQLHRDWRDPKKAHPERVEKLTKTWKRDDGTEGRLVLDYVGHANLRDILCSADPLWTWTHAGPADTAGNPTPLIDRDSKGWARGLWINLTVHGVTKPGYGTCAPGKPDAVKELIGDALRNAAQSFGIAIALWVKSDLADIGDWERLAQLEAEEASENGPEAPSEGAAAPEAPQAQASAPAPEKPAQAPQAAPAPDGQCPECHAPAGRGHASACSRREGAQAPAAPPDQNGQPPVNGALTGDDRAGEVAAMERPDLEKAVGDRLRALRGDTAKSYAEQRAKAGWPGDMTQATDDQLRAALVWFAGMPVERVVTGR